MPIGPDPSTRTYKRSVRLSTLDQLRQPVEEVVRVVRPGGRLRVVLHRERRDVPTAQPLDHVVVEAHVTDVDGPEGRLRLAVARRVHREAMVVRGHLDLAGGAVQDRLVDAAV